MSAIRVRLEWLTGLTRPSFGAARLSGSWDSEGRYSKRWTATPMTPFTADDGCAAWRAEIDLDASQRGWVFHWGVIVDGPQRANVWAIPTEVAHADLTAQHRDFTLDRDGQIERYYLTHCRRLGANKVFLAGAQQPALRFSLWAPNARKVDVVIGDAASGYIWSDGRGVLQAFPTSKDAEGIWSSDPNDPALANFKDWDHKVYMYRIERDDGSARYRTDLHSRCQIGGGRNDPEAEPNPEKPPPPPPWDGTRQDLKGTKGCSVIIDPERVTALLNEGVFPETQWLSEPEFWANEYDPLRPVPDRLEEMVIYEMHVEGLATGGPTPGTFQDAIQQLDYLVELGVNAIELLPTSEAESWTWGYGTSHYFATEYAGGGRDQLKHFVRACHQRGIAVLMDVVYNHYVADSERSQWQYDTASHERNGYYWYQGHEGDWPFPEGGYLDNGSTGYTPNFRSEMVRKLFISSAAMLLTEFHIDGFRVDLTQAMHRDNVFHANGLGCVEANRFGAKFLREWVRTLRLLKPSVVLMAEDHTGWRAITQPQETGGIGFDAVWWADWYHNLIGDSQNSIDNSRLIYMAGLGGNEPLAMGRFAGVIAGTPLRVIYHESHDQAGNAYYELPGPQRVYSARTIEVAVNGHLADGSRPWAEARCRVACGLTLLTPGVPMFFMGEEVGAREPYRYNDWIDHREDFGALRRTTGARLFEFYRDVIRLRRANDAFNAPAVEVVHAHDANRVIAFRRRLGEDEFLVVASLNNAPFADGYWLSHGSIAPADWIEVLNSDAAMYGGRDVVNGGTRSSTAGAFNVRVPSNGIAVFQRI